MQPHGVAWNRSTSQPHATRMMKILADLLITCVACRPALFDKAHKPVKADDIRSGAAEWLGQRVVVFGRSGVDGKTRPLRVLTAAQIWVTAFVQPLFYILLFLFPLAIRFVLITL